MNKIDIKGLSLAILCKLAGVPGRLRHGEENHQQLRASLKKKQNEAIAIIKNYFGK